MINTYSCGVYDHCDVKEDYLQRLFKDHNEDVRDWLIKTIIGECLDEGGANLHQKALNHLHHEGAT